MKKTNTLFSLLKGILTAVGVTVIGIAALALFAKDTEGSFLNTISLVIKITSIISGTIVSAIKIRKRGAVTGVITAVVYWLVCLLLSLIVEPLQLSFKILIDLFFACLIGIFAGILTVNALKR